MEDLKKISIGIEINNNYISEIKNKNLFKEPKNNEYFYYQTISEEDIEEVLL